MEGLMFLKVAKNKSKIEEKQKLFAEIRKHMKNSDIANEYLNEKKVGKWIFDAFPLDFDDIDVTAKTVNGTIYLSPKVMEMNFDIVMRYVIHEFIHVLQHINEERDGDKKSDKNQDYLDREDEIEAFQAQIEYDAQARGPKAVEKYVDDLLDFHEIEGKDKKEKKKTLLEVVK